MGEKTGTLVDLGGAVFAHCAAILLYTIHMSYIIGIDEAGRGPLAGPVAVGAVIAPQNFQFSIFKNLKDSKKLSEKRREEIFAQMQLLKREGALDFSVALVSHTIIDTKGISYAIRQGIKGVLNKLCQDPTGAIIKLDGGLKAPEEFQDQETLIKGDELVPAISLASIAAKVTRDRHMRVVSRQYPVYGLEIHKGYGTKMHMDCLKIHGLSPVHRRTFVKF